MASFIDELRDTIVENYDGDVFADYRRAWIASVLEYFKIKDIDLVILNNVVMKCIYSMIIHSLKHQNQIGKISVGLSSITWFPIATVFKRKTRRSASRRSI